MAPFDRNGGDDLLAGEWDSWSLGAAHREFFIRPECDEDQRLIREYDPPRQTSYELPVGRCSGGPRELLDIQLQRSRAAASARALWNEWKEFSAGFPVARSLVDLIAEEPNATVRRAGPAWQKYAAQPLVRELLSKPELRSRFGDQAVGDFGVGVDRFVQVKVYETLARDALLTLDGEWLSRESMPHEQYIEFFNSYLDGLSPQSVVVNVTYHS
ncbi:hypothetical protein PV330_14505 [Streptomyces caniscabiei]|nr:hypothetical protein [Streptomyces caniscabiei]MDX2601231.1 hypothetical protein [Streptomyces caniscabiei]